MKEKSIHICTQCNYKSIKWLGCCPECKTWDSFDVEVVAHKSNKKITNNHATLVRLEDVSIPQQARLLSGIGEWDRVMGGGIMPSSLIMLTGDPGIGKSTLLLQIAYHLAYHQRIFYFSTEESIQQVKQRAERLSCMHNNILFSDQSDLETILTTAQQEKPDILIIDSIQNCYVQAATSLPGSTGQLREATFQLMRLAKEQLITIILSGHITKEGVMAGPKTLEHMVDAVFYLQGEDRWQTRVLRSVKNRFGTINELGFFHMEENGLQEVPNINAQLLSEVSHSPGSVLISTIEGSRPLLLELQALTIESKLSMPQRIISGIDHKQVVLIAAILEKYLHIKLSVHDIFFKVGGGFSVKSSSVDLGIALALLSSYFQQPLPQQSLTLGEINLTGHIKPINHINLFVKEAEKFNIESLLLAKNQHVETITKQQRFNHVYELLTLFSL